MKQYLAMYAVNQVVYFESIPKSSANILIRFNKQLFNEGQKPSTILYKTDSLITPFSQIEKANRGSYDYPAFVSTDPNDPTKGHDTLVKVPASFTLNDSSNYQYLYYVLKGNANNLHIEAISAAYMLPIQDFQLSFFQGFMKYKGVMSLSAFEKAFCLSPHLVLIVFLAETYAYDNIFPRTSHVCQTYNILFLKSNSYLDIYMIFQICSIESLGLGFGFALVAT